MAGYVAAYRIGMLVSGAGVIGLSAWLEAHGPEQGGRVAARLCRVRRAGRSSACVAVLLAREPAVASSHEAAAERAARSLARLRNGARAPSPNSWRATRRSPCWSFVVLFKLCDALAGAMTAPFVLSLGYDKATYAAIVKGVGLAALLIGGFAGGAVARAMPLATALWLGAVLQMVSNLAFVWLGCQPPSAWR